MSPGLTGTVASPAVFGTAVMSPITAIGRHGQPWQESLVTFGFATLGVAIILASILILYGLRRNAPVVTGRE
jgi:hydroxylaminobenzene mutase